MLPCFRTDRMESVILSVLLLPLISSLVTLLFLRKRGNVTTLLSVATAGGFGLFLYTRFFKLGMEFMPGRCPGWKLADWELKLGFLDGSARLLLFVAFEAF